MQNWENQLNVLYLLKLNVYHGKNVKQSNLKIIFWFELDYYANYHIISMIYAKLKNIELLPFLSEK